jgi:tetratricopeptide (TPR) repeat protein
MIGGCGIPLFPIPMVKFAPPTEPLAEKSEKPLVLAAFKEGKGSASELKLAVRSGHVRAVARPKTDEELIAGLPSAELKPEIFTAYIPPYSFKPQKVGSKHYYNFTVTPEFAQATALYLEGKGEEAIDHIEQILRNSDNHPALLWQSSHLKVQVLLMMGRPDLAEKETERLEKFELAAMKGNHASRALRAEVRYWVGDLEGAAEDASQVIRAFGSWRFPAVFSTPPRDQVELARCTTAQVRANIILGLVLIAKGRHREALPWLELANQTMNNVMYTARHPITGLYFYPPEEIFWGRGLSLAALGNALLTIDPQSQRAEEQFLHAQEYFNSLGFKAGAVVSETFKAHALLNAGQYIRAEQQAGQGVALAAKLGLLDYLWRLEAIRGKALLALQRTTEAEQALRHSQAIVDLMAGTMAADDEKVRFGVGKEGITRDLIRLDIQKGDMKALFEDLERGRARSFVALLADRIVAEGREQELIAEIRRIDRNIRKERQRKNALSSQESGNAGLERALLDQRHALVMKLRQRDPELADAISISAIELPIVQKRLLAGEVIIYALPLHGGDPLQLLLITRDHIKLKTLKITAQSLREHLEAFDQARRLASDHLDRRSITIVGKEPQIFQAFSSVKAALIPLQRDLALDEWGVERKAYIVPSGDLFFIPWGAMEINYPVMVLPTGGWLARPPFSKTIQVKACAIGDPNFGGLLPQLTGARMEASRVAERYGVKPLLGSSATETAVRQSVGNGVGILHFATHALYDAHFPLQSALILSDGQQATPLTAERLYEKPLSAKLVVLSACETGMGKVAAGDDLLGLARSFYLGGARSMLSSLWPVEDEATRLFMETFYEYGAKGDYGHAWLAARDRLKDQGYSPSIYGAFILSGS